jgi:hypothetical protein
MLNKEDHRIYSHLSEPIRFMGLTKDEILTGFIPFIFAFYFEWIVTQLFFFLLSIGGVYGLKKGKKYISGFSVSSFMNWHVGCIRGFSSHWPKSWQRFWLG